MWLEGLSFLQPFSYSIPNMQSESTSYSQTPNSEDKDDYNDTINILGKRKNGSEVWDYFEKIDWVKGSIKKMAKCKVANCEHKEFSCGNGGTTKPLWRHLESAHWQLYIKTEKCRNGKRRRVEDENEVIFS